MKAAGSHVPVKNVQTYEVDRHVIHQLLKKKPPRKHIQLIWLQTKSYDDRRVMRFLHCSK